MDGHKFLDGDVAAKRLIYRFGNVRNNKQYEISVRRKRVSWISGFD